MEYLVRWAGYGPEYDVWYNVKDLDNAPKLVKEYNKRFRLTDAAARRSLTKSSIASKSAM